MNNTVNDTVDTMNDQVKQLAEIQQRNLEPMRIFGSVAVEAFEHMARKNYAVMGDMIDFIVRQTGLSLKGDSLDQTMSAQIAEGKAFAELMNRRASEYADLANTIGSKFRQAGSEAADSFKAV